MERQILWTGNHYQLVLGGEDEQHGKIVISRRYQRLYPLKPRWRAVLKASVTGASLAKAGPKLISQTQALDRRETSGWLLRERNNVAWPADVISPNGVKCLELHGEYKNIEQLTDTLDKALTAAEPAHTLSTVARQLMTLGKTPLEEARPLPFGIER